MTGYLVVEVSYCRSRPDCVYVAFRHRHPQIIDWHAALLKRTSLSESVEFGDDVYWGREGDLRWTQVRPRDAAPKKEYEVALLVLEGGSRFEHPDRVLDFSGT